MSSTWYVYYLRCADASLYAGITTDVQRRVDEHNFDNKKAAKYTRVRRPVTLAYVEQAPDKSAASKREYQLKQLNKAEKEKLVSTFPHAC